jgi:4-hydroxythreonine-4-phosphate dehydrogenase
MNGAAVIAVAFGDPNGIGPEVAIKAALARRTGSLRVVLVGDEQVARWYVERCAAPLGLRLLDDGPLPPRDPAMLDLLPVAALAPGDFQPGQITAAAGRATLAYVAAAVAFARAGHVQAVVAGPHSETAIHAAGVPFAGYPGLLAELSGLGADDVYLLLIGGGLRIVHVTLHERLADALARLTPRHVENAAHAAVRALQLMGVPAPRVGVMGINPHAGEGGLFGPDDQDVTEPAVRALRAAGLVVHGPQGADLLLTRDDVDVFVAMFHDQGHIPVKLRAGRRSAALSVGAGLVFSSVGHGSGFDIAGQLRADPAPLLGTLELLATGGSTLE